jgi:hypothetical protein
MLFQQQAGSRHGVEEIETGENGWGRGVEPLISRQPKYCHSPTSWSSFWVALLTWMHMGKPLDSMRDAAQGERRGRVREIRVGRTVALELPRHATLKDDE